LWTSQYTGCRPFYQGLPPPDFEYLTVHNAAKMFFRAAGDTSIHNVPAHQQLQSRSIDAVEEGQGSHPVPQNRENSPKALSLNGM